jgi:hypothetical protein
MDAQTTEVAVKGFIQQIVTRLDHATGIAKAAHACAEAGNVAKAVEIALDIEQALYEATTLLNAASLVNRIRQT